MSESNDAAKRVKKFFSDSQKEEIASPLAKSRDYRLENTPPLPEGIEGIALTRSTSKRKALPRAKVVEAATPLEQFSLAKPCLYPIDFLKKADALQLRSIKSLRVKERFIAARELKKLSLEMQQWISSHVHQKVEVLGNEKVAFYNLVEKREERHFQIDRIIKYLSTS